MSTGCITRFPTEEDFITSPRVKKSSHKLCLSESFCCHMYIYKNTHTYIHTQVRFSIFKGTPLIWHNKKFIIIIIQFISHVASAHKNSCMCLLSVWWFTWLFASIIQLCYCLWWATRLFTLLNYIPFVETKLFFLKSYVNLKKQD